MGTAIVNRQLSKWILNSKKMKTKFHIPLWPQDENFREPGNLSKGSYLRRDYVYEGDEFLDDAIRTEDQDIGQIDGTYEAWKTRSARSLNK